MLQELHHHLRAETNMEMVALEKKMLEIALREWKNLPALGASYSLQEQKDVSAV